jgi:hypothetical protein
MRYKSLTDFLNGAQPAFVRGPLAVIMAEDAVEMESTLRHHLDIGFRSVLLLAHPDMKVAAALESLCERIDFDTFQQDALPKAVNQLNDALPGIWVYYGFNAEYLFHPFCESRTIQELLAFHGEERRDAILTYVIDLYAQDLNTHPNAVSLETALLDKSGYYALGRPDPTRQNHPRERQLDFFGGLRWRFEEHIPAARRKIDRIALFRTKPGLKLRPDFTFSDEEYNTYACPWHHNITAAVVSFRTAKALKTNPGSRYDIHDFKWHNSTKFLWNSQQLMDLGLMEPGQWF